MSQNHLTHPKKHSIKNYLNRFPYLWQFDRNTVARGVGVGLFTAIILFIPFQTIIAILFSILFRANLPTAFLLSWLSNPLTILPIAYFTSKVGNWILGESTLPMTIHDYHWSFSNCREMAVLCSELLQHFGRAYLVGLPVVAITFAVLGYLVVFIFWNVGKRWYLSS